MNQWPRHKVVNSLSKPLLLEEVKKLVAEGWRPIGETSLAVPVNLSKPPYWVQAMYLSDEKIPLENHPVDRPGAAVKSENHQV
jgi:hypothetical protein